MTALLDALSLVLSRKLLWLVHVVGNAVMLLAVWWWLGLPDETVGQIAVSAFAAAVLLALFVWMHTAALAAYREPAGVPWMKALRRVPLLAIWLAVLIGVCWAVLRYIGPNALGFVVLGLALLALAPVASRLATGRSTARLYREWRYHALFLAVLVIGYVPVMLASWVPAVSGLKQELWSAGIRLTLGYLIAVTNWLLLVALVSRLAEVRGQAVAQPA
ncbi:MAG TPA: hypothetical protein VN428_22325 [Bryobacteraceae bacterium]|nr:hypothetical protein [Bryobacteraceae bacterium]